MSKSPDYYHNRTNPSDEDPVHNVLKNLERRLPKYNDLDKHDSDEDAACDLYLESKYEQGFDDANRDMTGQDLDNFVGDDEPDTPKHEH